MITYRACIRPARAGALVRAACTRCKAQGAVLPLYCCTPAPHVLHAAALLRATTLVHPAALLPLRCSQGVALTSHSNAACCCMPTPDREALLKSQRFTAVAQQLGRHAGEDEPGDALQSRGGSGGASSLLLRVQAAWFVPPHPPRRFDCMA